MENRFDVLARKLRKPFWAMSLVAIPVSFIAYGFLIKLMFESWPLWVAACVVVCNVIVIVGMSMLRDSEQEERQMLLQLVSVLRKRLDGQ